MPSLRTFALLGVTGLAGCLDPPPAAPDAAPLPFDSVPLDAPALDAPAPDALPRCAVAGECEQLLAVGLWRADPDLGSSVELLRRDAAQDTWTRIVGATGSPDGNIFDVSWGDCCGPTGTPDGLPDVVAANFYGLYTSQLRRPVDEIAATPLVAPSQPDIPALGVQGEWVDVDGDGDLDLLSGHPSLRWFPTTSAGIDAPIALDAAIGRIAVGSWDDDPEPEIAIADRRDLGGATPGRGVVVFDRVTGSWTTIVPVLAERVDTVLWCDLYDDAGLDLVVEARSDADNLTRLRILPNRGSAVDGSWLDAVAMRTIAVPMGPVPPMVCGDVDADGHDDLLVVTSSGLRVIFHGTVDPQLVWSPSSVAPGNTFVTDLILADLDRDGRPDVFVTLGDELSEEAVAETVVYHLPNRSSGAGQLAFGVPAPVLMARTDALSLAFVDFAVPPAR